MTKYSSGSWLEIQDMKEKMDHLMDQMREKFDLQQRINERAALWQPVTDAYETGQMFVIQMELPGLTRDQVAIEVQNRELWVYGERRLLKDVSGSSYQILERSYGPFARKFVLPAKVSQADIRASLENGLLTVTIPKIETGPSYRKIQVTEE